LKQFLIFIWENVIDINLFIPLLEKTLKRLRELPTGKASLIAEPVKN
jgi:hypothetical protein